MSKPRLTSSPAEDAQKLAGGLASLARRLAESEQGSAIFTREDVEKIVEQRLVREYRKRRELQKRLDECEDEAERLRREVEALS